MLIKRRRGVYRLDEKKSHLNDENDIRDKSDKQERHDHVKRISG